jgi:hypothetical protein
LEVEAIQLVARLLRIHHVLIDNEGRALGVVGDSLADLAGLLVCCVLGGLLEHTGLDQTCRRGRKAPRH